MTALPIGEHLVCIVATEVKRTKNNRGMYHALTLECMSGPNAGGTHTDRLNLLNDNKHAERIAEERLSEYCLAVGVHPSDFSNIDGLFFKPFVVTIQPQKKNPTYLEARKLTPVSPGWRADAEALCAARSARAPAPPTASANAQGAGWQQPGDALVIRRVSDVEAKPVRWLWPNRFALGKVSILAGDPGLGKSQLTNYLAAQVSNGGTWPNGEGWAERGDVIILSCEDDLADTIRPRLEAARADLTRVHVIEAIMSDDGKRRGFRLTDDLQRLERALQVLHGTARLVVIDPITAYMGKTDSHKVADVRAVSAVNQFNKPVARLNHFAVEVWIC